MQRCRGAEVQRCRGCHQVEIYYSNGDYFWGDCVHGVKEGSASVVLSNGDNLMGRCCHQSPSHTLTQSHATLHHLFTSHHATWAGSWMAGLRASSQRPSASVTETT